MTKIEALKYLRSIQLDGFPATEFASIRTAWVAAFDGDMPSYVDEETGAECADLAAIVQMARDAID